MRACGYRLIGAGPAQKAEPLSHVLLHGSRASRIASLLTLRPPTHSLRVVRSLRHTPRRYHTAQAFIGEMGDQAAVRSWLGPPPPVQITHVLRILQVDRQGRLTDAGCGQQTDGKRRCSAGNSAGDLHAHLNQILLSRALCAGGGAGSHGNLAAGFLGRLTVHTACRWPGRQ